MKEEKAVEEIAVCKHIVCKTCLKYHAMEITDGEILQITDYPNAKYKEIDCPMRGCQCKIAATDIMNYLGFEEKEKAIKSARYKAMEMHKDYKKYAIKEIETTAVLIDKACFECKSNDVLKIKVGITSCLDTCTYDFCINHKALFADSFKKNSNYFDYITYRWLLS
jgi:hypothetical protein